MRELIYILLKRELRDLALKTRYQYAFTQSRMAKFLCMSEHSYSEIETGVTSCGTVTAFLLVLAQEDPMVFLLHLKTEMDRIYEEEKQFV